MSANDYHFDAVGDLRRGDLALTGQEAFREHANAIRFALEASNNSDAERLARHFLRTRPCTRCGQVGGQFMSKDDAGRCERCSAVDELAACLIQADIHFAEADEIAEALMADPHFKARFTRV